MVKWDDTSDRKLLLMVIDPAAKPNWESVAMYMGEGYTAEACRQHYAKLKKSVLGDDAAGEGSPMKPKTPKKRKVEESDANANKTTATPKKSRKPKTPAKAVKDESDIENIPPVKHEEETA